jgi:hypothetical protein
MVSSVPPSFTAPAPPPGRQHAERREAEDDGRQRQPQQPRGGEGGQPDEQDRKAGLQPDGHAQRRAAGHARSRRRGARQHRLHQRHLRQPVVQHGQPRQHEQRSGDEAERRRQRPRRPVPARAELDRGVQHVAAGQDLPDAEHLGILLLREPAPPLHHLVAEQNGDAAEAQQPDARAGHEQPGERRRGQGAAHAFRSHPFAPCCQ